MESDVEKIFQRRTKGINTKDIKDCNVYHKWSAQHHNYIAMNISKIIIENWLIFPCMLASVCVYVCMHFTHYHILNILVNLLSNSITFIFLYSQHLRKCLNVHINLKILTPFKKIKSYIKIEAMLKPIFQIIAIVNLLSLFLLVKLIRNARWILWEIDIPVFMNILQNINHISMHKVPNTMNPHRITFCQKLINFEVVRLNKLQNVFILLQHDITI